MYLEIRIADEGAFKSNYKALNQILLKSCLIEYCFMVQIKDKSGIEVKGSFPHFSKPQKESFSSPFFLN